MNCGCLHTQFSSSAFLHSEGRNACLKSDLLKPSTQQGLSSLDSLKSSCSSLSLQLNSRISSECSTHVRGLVIKCSYPQNADPPPYHSKKEKKPFPIPIGQLRRAARERLKKSKTQPRGSLPPSKKRFSGSKTNSCCIQGVECENHVNQQSQEALESNSHKCLQVV